MALRTGDIILFNEHPTNYLMAILSAIIRCATGSEYSHAGLVIVDPPWAPSGIYIWDSSKHSTPDPQDKKIKFGIALVRLEDYLKTEGKHQLYKRSPLNPATYDLFTTDRLKKLHDNVYGKHYDLSIGHWMAGLFKVLIPRSTNSFFCSAFVSYALVSVGILSEYTDWTVVTPSLLSSKNDDMLNWLIPYGPDTKYI